MAEQLEDLSGRPLGARAQAKRRRILDATRNLLAERGLRELRVADIARHVDTSPATFYQYFADVEDVVLTLSREAGAEVPALLALFEGNWRGRHGRERSQAVVAFFMSYWDRHGAVLRVRNLAADEGDQRFMELRARAMRPILLAMEALMARTGAAQKYPSIHPASAALAMCAILDRLAAHHRLMEGDAVSHEELVTTTAAIIHRTLTGRG